MLGEGEQAGRIKVLDFGLAKLVDAQRGAAGASMLPTEAPAQTAPITAEGRILGTVAYMSPEQAEGRAIDARSDLFSLGVVLYEMATGQRPFTGDTNLSILSSILKDTPKSVTDINPAMPRELGTHHPPRARQGSRAPISDGQGSAQRSRGPEGITRIERITTDRRPTSNVAASAASPPSAAASPVPSSDTQIVVALVRRHSRASRRGRCRAAPRRGGRSLRAAAARRATGVEPSTSPFADLQVTQLTTSGNAERPAISPDGRYVAYVQRDGDDHSLWIRQTATTNNVRIVPPERGVTLFGATFTPDGTSVDFVRQASRRAVGDLARAVSWRHAQIVGRQRGEPHLVGARRQAHRVPAHSNHPQLSSQLFVADADGGQERELASQGDSARRGSHWSLPGDRASLRPGHPTAGSLRSLPRIRLRRTRSCSWTAAPGRYRTSQSPAAPRADSAGSMPSRSCSTSSPARRPEPVVSAAVSRRSAVEAHQRSE